MAAIGPQIKKQQQPAKVNNNLPKKQQPVKTNDNNLSNDITTTCQNIQQPAKTNNKLTKQTIRNGISQPPEEGK